MPGRASALRNGVAGFAAGGSSLDRQKSRANLRVNSAMQIDDQRVREDARGMLAPGPSCVPPGAAAQTRMVSVARIRLGSWESARAFKGIICDDVSEFESYMPSQAVPSLWCSAGTVPTIVMPAHLILERSSPRTPKHSIVAQVGRPEVPLALSRRLTESQMWVAT